MKMKKKAEKINYKITNFMGDTDTEFDENLPLKLYTYIL